jgi:serine/threonine protein kinase
MSDHPHTPSPSSSLSEANRKERACAAFAEAWKTGERPQLEPYLESTQEPQAAELFAALLELELTYRVRAGEQPVVSDYLVRFPSREKLIRSIFHKVIPEAGGEGAKPPSRQETPRLNPPAPVARLGDSSTILPQREATAAVPFDLPNIPGYELLAELGRGGMGVVYKARQTHLNRTVALKMIRAGEYVGAQELARFRIEAEAAARLDHPHIVRIYEFGVQNDRPYFSMEFVEGENLARRSNDDPMPPGQAAQLVEALAQAVHYIHQHHIVHRDLKPANVLLTAAGVPKIADFGLAKRLDSSAELSGTSTPLSASGIILGTASYMAPEQAAGKTKEIGPPVDIYALGAILYELLTGRPPFLGETRALTIVQVMQDEPVQPSRLRPDLPRDLEAICLKCLEKDPARRYDSAGALAEDLRRYLAGEAISIATVEDWQRRTRWAQAAGYEVLGECGRGAWGEVYKARHLGLDRLVALKVIRADPRSGFSSDRFRVGAIRVARLQHPNLVAVYDVGEKEGFSYVAMEWVEGGSLAELIAAGPQPVLQAARLVRTLAEGLHCAHQNSIFHGNLKPANVLVSAGGLPKITDFNLPEFRADVASAEERLRRRLPYLAPEQTASDRSKVGPPSDIYALGALLYELLTGQLPFRAETGLALLDQIAAGEPVPPAQLRPEVPHELEAICLKCLAKDPSSRFSSAQSLAEALERFLTRQQSRSDARFIWVLNRGVTFVCPGCGWAVEVPDGTFSYDTRCPACAKEALQCSKSPAPSFEVLDELGRGSLGVVYKARQVNLNRLVALKVIRYGSYAQPGNRQSFRDNLTALTRLLHPNLVPICGFGQQDASPYFAMELLEGGSLAQQVAAGAPPIATAAQLVEVLARAMQFAHERGILHGNLRPANVLLQDGTLKITDLGLNEPVQPEEPNGPFASVVLIRNPSYLAPEQVGDEPWTIGPQTDVYALGTILYTLLTRRVPFWSNKTQNIAERVRYAAVESLQRLRPEVPAELEAICMKCLRKDPKQRYATAAALASDLQRFLSGRSDSEEARSWWGRSWRKIRQLWRRPEER